MKKFQENEAAEEINCQLNSKKFHIALFKVPPLGLCLALPL